MGEIPLQKDNDDPFIGRIINERFEIISLIARGGMGRVYRARQQPLGRLVALKVLDPRQADLKENTDFQTRFFLEAATAAKLSHPNTVTIFDYGKTEDDIFYIAMELVEGRTLASILREYAPMESLRAVHIAVQIARSLREAHSLEIIHRDLKPANILITTHVDEEDFVKVLDFGLVKDLKDDLELTQAGLFMGSPKYMAPEQIQGENVDARADVYALGCILYYMLSGRVPFDGDGHMQILMAHCQDPVPPMVRADGVTIPQSLVSVTLKCLAKEKEKRFTNMNEVIIALKHASSQAGMPLQQMSGSLTQTEIDFSGMRQVGYDQAAELVEVEVNDLTTTTKPPPLTASFDDGHQLNSQSPVLSSSFSKWMLAAVFGLLAGALIAVMVWIRSDPRTQDSSYQGREATAAESNQQRQDAIDAQQQVPSNTLSRVHFKINTNPLGATIIIDGQPAGLTSPAEIEWSGDRAQRGREIVMRFEKDGYHPASITRTIDADEIEISANLEPIESTTRIRPRTDTMSGARGSTTQMNNSFRDNPY